MPEYCYENSRGEKLTLYRKVEDRDLEVPDGYRRIIDPGRLGFTGIHPVYMGGDQVLKGCKEREAQVGTAQLAREMQYTASQTKRIWEKKSSASRF